MEDFRWHDLRDTLATWHAQKRDSAACVQQLGAWESPQMARRYAHVPAEHWPPLQAIAER